MNFSGVAITVTSTADSGPGSLRAAIAAANPGDTIDFAVAGPSIVLTTGSLVVTNDLTIQGPGATVLAINGNNTNRIECRAAIVTISDLTYEDGGIDTGPSCDNDEPPTCNPPGLLTLHRCVLSNSDIFATKLRLVESVVSSSPTFGVSTAEIVAIRSTVKNNTGGGISVFQIHLPGDRGVFLPNTSITDCTISGNTGPGIQIGASLLYPATTTIFNSTISGNSGVGLSLGWAGSVDNCTITQNSQGGVKIYQPDFFDTTVRFSNNIIAGNSGGPDVENVDFVFSLAASNGHNLIGAKQPFIDADGLFVDIFVDGVNGDQVGTLAAPLDPLLGPLQANGGPTFTHALLPGSPAIDAGSGVRGTDQRGFPRPFGGNSDIGAYELNILPCQNPLSVNVYSGFRQFGGGTPFSGLVGTFGASDVMFATTTGFDWHPFGLLDFGAELKGVFDVTANGNYTFTLNSDDGSRLYIDGLLVANNGHPHGPAVATGTVPLTAGTHSFEIQFFECCGGESGVDLLLPPGVSYACPPDCTITCQSDITVGLDPGHSSAVVNYAPPTMNGNCSGVTVECQPPSGSTFPVGTTVVICTAVDSNSQSLFSCWFNVIVLPTPCPTPPINVNVYSGFNPSGGGAPYGGLVGSFNASAVTFASDFGYGWHPFALFDFGADITGALAVPANGTYTFTLDSDDGSLLFIDGALVVDNSNPHSPTAISGTATLSAGTHPFEIQFFECCGGPSGVDLILPLGVSYACPSDCVDDTEPPNASYTTIQAFQTFPNPLRRVGHFKLFASDNCDPVPLIYISDSVTGFVAGPFHNGDQVEIAKGPSLSNSQHAPAGGPNSAVIFLQGGARMYSVDSAGNTSPITKVL
jgi:hypothetical protein